ncbi:MAG: hypothetical protein IKV58_01895 [Oscillospiraceae bacterium]|nr:hypothetical protein [Oscillospiraceae bacterium]
MSENCVEKSSDFKEAVCIDASRIYDSCADKECLSDVTVVFSDEDQAVIESAISLKEKCASVLNVDISVDSVPFHQGFYSVCLTFYIGISFDALITSGAKPVAVEGCVIYNKRVVLYGSGGSVKTFLSNSPQTTLGEINCCNGDMVMPVASVQVATPVVLSSRICDAKKPKPHGCIPECVAQYLHGSCSCEPNRVVTVTLGLFSIVSLKRDVSVMIPVYDFCLPTKDCSSANTQASDPCDMFKKIKFPIDDFFPPKMSGQNTQCDCE